MDKDALQRFREPAAFALLGAAGLQVLAGLVALVVEDGSFTGKSLGEAQSAGYFSSFSLAAISLLAILVVTRGESPSPQARIVVMVALGILGLAILFGVITTLAALGAGGGTTVPMPDGSTRSYGGVPFSAKLVGFLYGVSKLVVTGMVGFYAFQVFQKMQPPKPAAVPGGLQQGYPQYGQPGYDPNQYQQQQYGQQQYGQQGYDPNQYQQQQYGQQQQPEGGWTQQYGGEQQQQGQQQGYGQEQQGGWYQGGQQPPQ